MKKANSSLSVSAVDGREIAFYGYPTGAARLIGALLVGFPIYTMTRLRGLALSPRALRRLGLVEALEREGLKITDMGDVKLQKLSKDSGPKKFRNPTHTAEATERIRRAALRVPEREFAIFLGGECSLVMGSLSGMKNRRRGEPGCSGWTRMGTSTAPRRPLPASSEECASSWHAGEGRPSHEKPKRGGGRSSRRKRWYTSGAGPWTDWRRGR